MTEHKVVEDEARNLKKGCACGNVETTTNITLLNKVNASI
jgi:hypothetical protein